MNGKRPGRGRYGASFWIVLGVLMLLKLVGGAVGQAHGAEQTMDTARGTESDRRLVFALETCTARGRRDVVNDAG